MAINKFSNTCFTFDFQGHEVTFDFKGHQITALGELCSKQNSNVYELNVPDEHRSLFEEQPTIILKVEKPQWVAEFDSELTCYELLRDEQGKSVPTCYGKVSCDIRQEWGTRNNCRGILLSKMNGCTLGDEDFSKIEMTKLERMLEDVLSRTYKCGVKHGDLKLHNIFYDKSHEKITIFDWEYFDAPNSDDHDRYVQDEAKGLLLDYKHFVKNDLSVMRLA